MTSQAAIERRIRSLVFALGLASVLAIAMGFAVGSWCLESILERRNRVDATLAANAQLQRDIEEGWRGTARLADAILDPTESQTDASIAQTGPQLERLKSSVERHLSKLDGGDEAKRREFAESRASLQHSEAFVGAAIEARQHYDRASALLAEAADESVQRLSRIGADLNSIQGREKLKAVTAIRGPAGKVGTDDGSTLRGALSALSAVAALSGDLADMREFVRRVMLVETKSDLASLERNNMAPALSRMSSSMSALDASDSVAASLTGHVRSLGDTLGLQSELTDIARNAVESGLLPLRASQLDALDELSDLRSEFDGLNLTWSTLLRGIGRHGLEVNGSIASELRDYVAGVRAWWITPSISFGVFVLVLVLTIDRYARRQLAHLDATTSQLHGANRSMAVQIAALESAPDGVAIFDAELRPIWSNSEYRRLTGEEADGGASAVLPDCGARSESTRRQMLEALAERRPSRVEKSGACADGSTYGAELAVTPVLDPGGSGEHLVTIVRNVTHAHAREERLRKLHDENELMLTSLSALLIGTDASGRITSWNSNCEALLETAAGEATGSSLAELKLIWDHGALLRAVNNAAERRETTRLEDVTVKLPSQRTVNLSIIVSPLVDRGGALRGCVLLGRDVTAQRALESQLRQAQKLEAIGQLAAGIAHEINTPTQFVSDNTRFVRDSFVELAPLLELCRELAGSDDATCLSEIRALAGKADLDFLLDEIPKALGESMGGLTRVSSIVSAMKQFSHPGTGHKELINLNRALESTATVARNEWKYVAELTFDLDPDLPLVPCLPGELNQAVLNMIVNAAHAIGDVIKGRPGAKGSIRVATRRLDERVQITVSDTGGGIPDAIKNRIFDPFFTTKDVGKGTGQGLAIARMVVVDKHRGTLEVDSQVGVGTTFKIELPLQSADETNALETPLGASS